MSRLALADDAVSVRRARVRGMTEGALRRELAIAPTPQVRRFVFVRRVTLRGAPAQIGQTLRAALSQLAQSGREDVLTFADFPALAVACAREALGGGLSGWWWRTLGLPASAAPGEAVAALLAGYPLEAGSAVAALDEHGMLAPVWRSMPEAAAAHLIEALARAAGFSPPAWPDPPAASATGPPAPTERALLSRSAAMWRGPLSALPPGSEAVRLAGVLALMRWAPRELASARPAVWPALLGHIAAQAPLLPTPDSPGTTQAEAMRLAKPSEARDPAPDIETPRPSSEAKSDPAAPDPSGPDPVEEAATALHGVAVATEWAGVLMLINALERLQIEGRLAEAGLEAPTGWRLLHDLGVASGMPVDEPLALFLAGEDLETVAPPRLLDALLQGLEDLYRSEGPWPLPLAQPGVLRATETHLDLEFGMTEIDLATRLAGLDFNPGWTPWLGRVVAFHYNLPPTLVREDR